MTPFRFEIIHESKRSRARAGIIHTPHGTIETPSFVAVGTNGTLKALHSDTVDAIGLKLMFCNTYHLLLQPGPDIVEKAGGLHRFINRKNPLITDSGGFQVFSLAFGSVHEELKSQGKKSGKNLVIKISEEGVLFRSYRDGKSFLLSPETSVEAQKKLGADIIIPFDELPPYHISHDKLISSIERTHRWEMRSLEAHLKDPRDQAMYGVVHGGIHQELRQMSATFLREKPFDGFAIGGSVGKNREELIELIRFIRPHLPNNKPNHLLGIGDVASLKELIPLGIDTFDSSFPTKAARHGLLLTREGGIKIEKSEYKTRFEPIEKGCSCSTCREITLAYLHHLFKANELSALSYASIHNLTFMVTMMKEMREKILRDEI